MAEITAAEGQGAARAHRRRHDGLQEGARGIGRRHRQGRRSGCARRAWPRPPRRPAAKRAKASCPAYIHAGGRLGVLIEVNCETDFVARNEDFQKLVRELAMQVAGLAPEYMTVDSIPAEVLEAKRAELLADETTHEEAGEHPRPDRRGPAAQVVSVGRALRAAVPRHRPDRRPADHRRDRHASARTSASAASRATSSGKRFERGHRLSALEAPYRCAGVATACAIAASCSRSAARR